MKEKKLKHLEFIQNVINRHNSNSFMIKGWTITISAALFALAGTINEPIVVFIALVPIIMFWGLDAYYLSNERCFVDLFNAAIKGKLKLPASKMFKKEFNENDTKNVDIVVSDFNMSFKQFKIWKENLWSSVIKSRTILGFYLPMFFITILIAILLLIFSYKAPDVINVDANIKSHQLELQVETDPPTIINNIYPLDSCKRVNKTK